MLTNNQNEINLLFERIQHLAHKGINPYPNHFARTCPLYEVNEDYEDIDDQGVAVLLNLCGRVTVIQTSEKGMFIQIQDRDTQLDCQFHLGCTDDGKYLKNEIAVGDFIGIKTDFLYRHQQSGQLTAQVCDWYFLSLSLDSSLQAKAKREHTFLHIATDYKAREQLLLLSKITRYVRHFLETHYDFFDFSTAMLSKEHTHDNKLAIEDQSFLRPSVFLKQLIVGGLERVYEIYDNNLYGQRGYPQSQILECFMTLLNLSDMLNLAEKLVSGLAKYLHSTYTLYWISIDVLSVLSPNNLQREILIDLTPPWSRRFFYQLIEETIGIDFLQLQTIEEAVDVARREGVTIPKTQHFDFIAQVGIEVFNQLIAPHLIQPTFVAGYPIEVYPTAKPHRSNPRVAEIAHLFINGFQFATAVSDQNNPYELQMAMQAYTKTDLTIDPHFLTALNYGIPPVGHLTIFLERLNLLMLGITNMQEIIPDLT